MLQESFSIWATSLLYIYKLFLKTNVSISYHKELFSSCSGNIFSQSNRYVTTQVDATVARGAQADISDSVSVNVQKKLQSFVTDWTAALLAIQKYLSIRKLGIIFLCVKHIFAT
jgi:hypothetical protein